MNIAPRGVTGRAVLWTSAIAVLFAVIGGLTLLRFRWQSERSAELERLVTALETETFQVSSRGVDDAPVFRPDLPFVAAVALVPDRVIASTGPDELIAIARASELALTDPTGPASVVRREIDGDLGLVSFPCGYETGACSRIVAVVEFDSFRYYVGRRLGWLVLATAGVSLLVGGAVALSTRRALGDVERLRSAVAAIDSEPHGTRVPVSATGDEVERLGNTLNDLLGRIDAAMVAQREFVADASHELRTPVAALRAQVESAARNPDDVDPARLYRRLEPIADRVSVLIDQLLLLARSDAGELADMGEDVDLDDLVFTEVAALRPLSDTTWALDNVYPTRVSGNVEQLRRVVSNLLSNAERHASGQVSVSLRLLGDEAVLRVDDDGEGVPADLRERIFERFVRADTSRSARTGGVGLGLAIAAGAVADHDGSVELVGPSTFEVRLPRGQR
ncbi:MAG: HAMP domain-containing histidine kinase [Actinomycetia bacterium]|nr:HAMP domain-containing histidine kinase [Actinomycetes bacterium]MCP4960402.1 HAMP domain-containing histidine kinase [Actinomycetes bacterium]